MTIKTEILEWHMDPQDVPEHEQTVTVLYMWEGKRRRTEGYWDVDMWLRAHGDSRIRNVIGWADPKGPTT